MKERQGRQDQSNNHSREQSPYGGSTNRPELPPPKDISLPLEPNLPSQEQQPDDLDPEVERLLRAYAEAKAEGDPKKEKRLLKQYMKDSSLIEPFKNLNLRGTTTLTSSGRDLSKLMEKQEKEE